MASDMAKASIMSSSSNSAQIRRRILDRIEREAGVPNLVDTLSDRLVPTDLQSLLLEVYERRAKRRDPKALLSDHISNRFTRPAACDPAILLEWDRIAFSRLPKVFQIVELSPVCPLGTVSVVAPISQDWTVSTSRNTEVVSDATNVLAIECAVRRFKQARSNPRAINPVHLAASHRLLRGQKFATSPGIRQHFKVFSLCSAGRDSGNLRFETDTVGLHIRFYLEAMKEFLGVETQLRVTIAEFDAEESRPSLRLAVFEKLESAFEDVRFEIGDQQADGSGYYRQMRFKIVTANARGSDIELVDGGDVDWTQKLLNNAKERLIISGCGSERLCDLFGRTPNLKTTRRKFQEA